MGAKAWSKSTSVSGGTPRVKPMGTMWASPERGLMCIRTIYKSLIIGDETHHKANTKEP